MQVYQFFLCLEALALPGRTVLLLEKGIVGWQLSFPLVDLNVLLDELLNGEFRIHLVLFEWVDTPDHFLRTKFTLSDNIKDGYQQLVNDCFPTVAHLIHFFLD